MNIPVKTVLQCLSACLVMCNLLDNKSHITLKVSLFVFMVLEVKLRTVQLLGKCSAQALFTFFTTYISVYVCVCLNATCVV